MFLTESASVALSPIESTLGHEASSMNTGHCTGMLTLNDDQRNGRASSDVCTVNVARPSKRSGSCGGAMSYTRALYTVGRTSSSLTPIDGSSCCSSPLGVSHVIVAVDTAHMSTPLGSRRPPSFITTMLSTVTNEPGVNTPPILASASDGVTRAVTTLAS